jgi:predicted O-methyltransferase YrrM
MLNFEYLRDSDAMTREEGELLYGIVRAIKPTYCIETGTHKGLSACYIGQALRDNGQGILHTCDPVDLMQEAAFASNGLLPHVKFHLTRGVDLRPQAPIDFLFIDGFHGKQDVLDEFVTFKPHLAENAIVAFHDCDLVPHCGVNQAVAELGLVTVWIPTQNRMRLYSHKNV